MRFGSLFSGIGGIDLGLERAGMQCAWQVEIDEFCTKVLRKHWPDVPRFRDVREVGKHNLERVDLIAGGFPCQDVSRNGKQAGLDGERSGLWSEFHRIICELRPDFVLVENVPGLLDDGGIGRVLGDLAISGYDAEWQVLPASAFGFFHERARVFILAYPATQNQHAWNLLEASEERRASLQSRRLHSVAVAQRAARTNSRLECEPGLARLVHGVPDRTHRLEALGNAVVPQVAQWIGERIMEEVSKCQRQ